MSDEATGNPERRGFLKQLSAALGTLPLAATVAVGAPAAVPTPASAEPAGVSPLGLTPFAGYTCFSQDEATFVETMVNIMCPADAMTPSGVDCALPVYIDRQLAGDFGRGWKRYARGPWQAGKPQQGYQLPLSPQEWFKVGIVAANSACMGRFGKAFDQLTAADGDAFLNDLAAGKLNGATADLAAWFNDLVYPLFAQACFADPIYGGNVDKVFWKMIGYPGLPATHTIDMVQFRGKPFPGSKNPKSIADFS